MDAGLRTFLKQDQIERVAAGNKRSTKPFSDETIAEAILIRASVQSTGYRQLCIRGWPLPKERTLQLHIQHIKLAPGILHLLIRALGMKLAEAAKPTGTDPKGIGKYAALTFDEMAHRYF